MTGGPAGPPFSLVPFFLLAQVDKHGLSAAMREVPDDSFESRASASGARRIAGVDEAGRGPLAGPVLAAAVVLDPARLPAGLADSKVLSASRREAVFEVIQEMADVAVGVATVEEIDRLNILRASHLAMVRALRALEPPVDFALIDGNMVPSDSPVPAEAVVRGDARCLSVAAASIVAKVTRDRIMVDLAQQYPGYGWDTNAGYPTRAHVQAIRDLGVTPSHRRSFRPVHNILCREKSVSD